MQQLVLLMGPSLGFILAQPPFTSVFWSYSTGYLHQMDKHNQWVTPPALTPVLFLFNSLPNPLLKEGKIIKKEKREMELMLEV